MKQILLFQSLILIINLFACQSESGQAANAGWCDTLSLGANQVLLVKDPDYTSVQQHPEDSLFESGVKIGLPRLANQTKGAEALNRQIAEQYKNRIEEQLAHPLADKEHFYQLDYSCLVADSILTLIVIEQEAWHLSEGLISYGIFHYDGKNDQVLSTRDMLRVWGVSMLPLVNGIVEQAIQPGTDTEPDFASEWLQTINQDIDRLEIYRNTRGQFVVIYPWYENPAIENELILE